ncbi:MAG TPA: PfkB family carbohydrate kinase [Isosphaeraceae bacterium]
MILCVTLNPCLDKTLDTPAWGLGDNVRGASTREVVGGKGNNVARALKRLGREARPATFLGGFVGAQCDRLLRRDDGFDPLVSLTEASTRVILTVRGEDTPPTAFFDPDPTIAPAEAADLLHRVEGALTAGGVGAITLSGSSPSKATDELYSEMIALALARRIQVFLDTYGPPLDVIWGFWPDLMQLNRREAGMHLRNPRPTDADVIGLLRRWWGHGVRVAVVTDGADPVLALIDGRPYRAMPPELEPVNPIGSGDCLLAGLVYARLRGLDPQATLRHAVGCATANARVWDAGAIDPETAASDAEAVEVEPL